MRALEEDRTLVNSHDIGEFYKILSKIANSCLASFVNFMEKKRIKNRLNSSMIQTVFTMSGFWHFGTHLPKRG